VIAWDSLLQVSRSGINLHWAGCHRTGLSPLETLRFFDVSQGLYLLSIGFCIEQSGDSAGVGLNFGFLSGLHE